MRESSGESEDSDAESAPSRSKASRSEGTSSVEKSGKAKKRKAKASNAPALFSSEAATTFVYVSNLDDFRTVAISNNDVRFQGSAGVWVQHPKFEHAWACAVCHGTDGSISEEDWSVMVDKEGEICTSSGAVYDARNLKRKFSSMIQHNRNSKSHVNDLIDLVKWDATEQPIKWPAGGSSYKGTEYKKLAQEVHDGKLKTMLPTGVD